MNLYIASIKLWFKGFREKEEFTKTFYFEPDKINVITGDSSTGKSSILGIIDYLLLSDNPTIVENIINENVEYYGMNIFLNGTSYILIRKAPLLGIGTQDVYWEERQEFPIPYVPTHTIGEMRTMLSEMFEVPEHETKVGHRKYSMTFRHFLPINYITEDIIASANMYFDTAFFISRSYDAFLDFALEYVNGIRCHNRDEVESAVKRAEKDLLQYQQKHQSIIAEEIKYKENLMSIYNDAVSLNLVPNDNLFIREDAHELQRYIQRAISEYDKLINNDEDTNKLEKLRKVKYDLKSKLSIYNSLLLEMKKLKDAGAKIKDSLRPISYIRAHIDEVISSPETQELLDLLEGQLVEISRSESEPSKLPQDFMSRYEELKAALEKCESELNRLSNLRKTIVNPRWVNIALSLKYRLKELKKPQVDIYQSSVEQDKLSKIESLNIQLKQIDSLPHDIKKVLNGYINEYFKSDNGMVDSYPDSTMHYDDEDRRVSLLKNGEEYSIRNVGSKSNYMFLHLCFFLGLHKSILAQGSSQVGSFLFIDQPSVPYYADNKELDNDDKKQLSKAFRLLNDFMDEIIDIEGGHFQIILIEHADESYWENLSYFHTAGKFNKAENGGLVPDFIYERR